MIDILWLGQGEYMFIFGKKWFCVDPYLTNTLQRKLK
jgi:hypothetical protein